MSSVWLYLCLDQINGDLEKLEGENEEIHNTISMDKLKKIEKDKEMYKNNEKDKEEMYKKLEKDKEDEKNFKTKAKLDNLKTNKKYNISLNKVRWQKV